MAHPLSINQKRPFPGLLMKKKRNGSAALGALPSARTRPDISCPFSDPNGAKTDQKQVRLGRRVGDGLRPARQAVVVSQDLSWNSRW